MARPSQVLIRIHASAAIAGPIIRELCIQDEKPAKKSKNDEPKFRLDAITPEADILIDEGRQIEMRKRGMEQARIGRGDTGVQVFGSRGVANGAVDRLIADLKEAGYQFVDAHYREQPQRDRETGRLTDEMKSVITFVFSREADDEPQDEEFLRDVLVYFAERPFRTVHVWQNDNSDTVNLAGGFDLSVGKYKRLRFGADGKYSVEEVVKPRSEKSAPRA